jgi:hypothetical protein
MTAGAMQLLQLCISGVLLPFLAWVAYTLVTLVKSMAAHQAEATIWRESRDREIVEIRARCLQCETALRKLELDMLKMGFRQRGGEKSQHSEFSSQ